MSAHDPTCAGRPRPLYGDLLAGGALCGEYVIETLLGRGGWGRVYLARHRMLRRGAAIKVLDRELAASPRAFERFVWEARAACRVRHPAVVDVLDLGRLPDGRPFLVMELLAGQTVEERLAARGRMAADEARRVIDAVAGALAAVHAVGVIHRDLKPANVFLHGPDEQVKLLDFGIAKLVAPDDDEPSMVTTATTRLGTPEAMAPEQIRGAPVDARTDVYGMGVLLYRMLTATWPFEDATAAEVERLHLEAAPAPPSACAPVSAAIDAVVLRALAKQPADRFADPLALAAALTAAVVRPRARRAASA